MEETKFVCGDWGTSTLRVSLCRIESEGVRVIETTSGPGVLDSRGHIEETLFNVIDAWKSQISGLPLFLAGMVGSNFGWKNIPYLQCPVTVAELSERCERFECRGHQVFIVPGLTCTNDLGMADVMRGEELQILGWLQTDPAHLTGKWRVCLPGTHTKWVSICDGRIESFRTSLTGEMFGLLQQHSTLLVHPEPRDPAAEFNADAFTEGINTALQNPGALLHLLFSTRSRVLAGVLSPNSAESYMSGLLIGSDCAIAMTSDRTDVGLVGDPGLCGQFSVALELMSVRNTMLSGSEAAMQGFARIFEAITNSE